MEFKIDLTIHTPGISGELQQVLADLRLLLRKVTAMSQVLDDLTAEVEEVKGAQASAIVLLQGLHDALVAAGTDPVKLQALTDSLKTSTDALAAAVASNPLPTP